MVLASLTFAMVAVRRDTVAAVAAVAILAALHENA